MTMPSDASSSGGWWSSACEFERLAGTFFAEMKQNFLVRVVIAGIDLGGPTR
ncbi:MAG: hypothetical protein QOJ44_2187 [Acidimicrobiaceae bacterium]|jgi:hypothetical protein|nr:hypothetical protein [Acidimicrobiaceae bacterium]